MFDSSYVLPLSLHDDVVVAGIHVAVHVGCLCYHKAFLLSQSFVAMMIVFDTKIIAQRSFSDYAIYL
jgi:hypothetical protein